jgi:hypothetical protein
MANNQAHREGEVATMLEHQTAKIPSDVYLWTAVGTMALSLGLIFARKKHLSLFFGQWAPSILIIGLYNKLVKVQGHDQINKDGMNEEQQPSMSASQEYQKFQ